VVVAADETGGLAGIQQAVLLGFGLLVCLFAAVLIVSVARVAR
jgi:hypothetical protein